MMWLKNIIQSQRIPILICLTHADKLYAEHITGGKYPTLEIALGVVEDYRKVSESDIIVLLQCYILIK